MHIAAFHYDIGALDNSGSEFSKVYENMFVQSRMNPSVLDTIFRATWRYFPLRLVNYVKYLPNREYSRLHGTRKVADRVASTLIDQATKDARNVGIEKGQKDVISVLGRPLIVIFSALTA